MVVQLHAREGMQVRKGTQLLVLSTEIQSETLGATRREVVRQLQSRRESLALGLERQKQLYGRQADDLRARIGALNEAQSHLEGQLQLQRARMVLSEQTVKRQSILYAGRLEPVDHLEQAQSDQLQQAANQQSLLREQGELLREHLALEAELTQLPLREAADLAETDRSIAALEQDLAEAEARREIVLVAPQDGTVSAVTVEAGGGVNTATPLLTSSPNVTLQAPRT